MDATGGAGTEYPSGTPEFTPSFSGVPVTRSLVLCVCFVDRCYFSFDHCVVCPSIYGFWLSLWYLQTLQFQRFLFILNCICSFFDNILLVFLFNCGPITIQINPMKKTKLIWCGPIVIPMNHWCLFKECNLLLFVYR